jgi:hypothetical protein
MALTQATKELIKNVDPSQLNQEGALNGQVLKYSTTTNKWEPGTVTGGGGGGSGNDVNINGASLAKAWVNFDGSGATGAATIRSSFNVSSVNKDSTGLYTITFATPFTDTNYLINGTAGGGSVSFNNGVGIYFNPTPSTTSCTVAVQRGDGSSLEDAPIVNVVFYANGGNISGNVVDNTPVGVINWFGATTPPTGYLECNGAAVLRTSYPDLDAAIYCGNATNGIAGFGYRCTSNTNPTGTRNATGQYIVLPDLRSEFIRGWDNGKNVDTGRAFGSNQTGTHITGDNGTAAAAQGIGRLTQANVDPPDGTNRDIYFLGSAGTLTSNSTDYWGQTRPRNVALLPCIKAQKTFSSTFNLLDYIEKPATPTNGQILSYDGTAWVASTGSSKINPLLKENILYPNVTNNITYTSLVEAGTLPTAAAIATANANVYAVGNYKKLSNGNWTVPASVRKIRVFAIGGNGGNGGGHNCTEGNNGGGGGGGGGICIRDITLTTGNTYTVVNGTNGIAGAYSTSGTSTNPGTNGTSSSFSGNGITMTGLGGNGGGGGGGGGCFTGPGGGAGGTGGTASGGQVNQSGTSGSTGALQTGAAGTPGSIPNLGNTEIGTGITILILELNDVAQNVSF